MNENSAMKTSNAMQTNETSPQIILASQSPRRRQLMSDAGYAFEVILPSDGAEDVIWGHEEPAEAVDRLAYQKAADVALRVERGIIIACDTVAECHGHILGKPENRDDARRMLTMLRNTTHRVLTGLCVWNHPDESPRRIVESTELFMEPISDQQLEEYLDSGQWEGKAGAFGYQDQLGWIRIVEGSASNVVGLPMERLAEVLEELGIDRP